MMLKRCIRSIQRVEHKLELVRVADAAVKCRTEVYKEDAHV